MRRKNPRQRGHEQGVGKDAGKAHSLCSAKIRRIDGREHVFRREFAQAALRVGEKTALAAIADEDDVDARVHIRAHDGRCVDAALPAGSKHDVPRSVVPYAADQAHAPPKAGEDYGFVHGIAARVQRKAGGGEGPSLKHARACARGEDIQYGRPNEYHFRQNGHACTSSCAKTNKTDV